MSTIHALSSRFDRLCASLLELANRTDALQYLDDGQGNGAGCVLRLTSRGGAVCLLEVSPESVTVTTDSRGVHERAGESSIVDRLGVDLTSRYEWDDVRCVSAMELAELLLKHMRRRVKEADPGPKLATE